VKNLGVEISNRDHDMALLLDNLTEADIEFAYDKVGKNTIH
jgi:hypothetical protein